tara:strand:+ start:733 stop:942 length:210 start_codon:yes stop_codon:yes gene_type:complete
MFKPSITVHKSPEGKLTLLALSEDADDTVNAYHNCKEEGEVQLIVRGQLQKQKKIDAPIIEKKATRGKK